VTDESGRSHGAAGDERFVSIVALGGLVARRPMIGRESLRQALIDVLGERRPEMIEANLAAFSSGYRAATTDVTGPSEPGSTRAATRQEPSRVGR
jgi:Pyruvate/2-oxoacid:ferredoxin oxidoreductase gamma subunit